MVTSVFLKLFIAVYYEKDNLWGSWGNLGYHSYKDKENYNSVPLLRTKFKKQNRYHKSYYSILTEEAVGLVY